MITGYDTSSDIPFTIHKTEIILKKEALKNILKEQKIGLNERGMNYIDLYNRIQHKYGLDITYKSFISLLNNRNTWKLLYAYAIIDILEIQIDDIFEIVKIDVEKRVKEKELWKKKYQDKEDIEEEL